MKTERSSPSPLPPSPALRAPSPLGCELTVIDVTHPDFAMDPSPEDLAAISAASLRTLRSSMRLPGFVRKLATRGSVLLREQDSGSPVLGGLTTYLQKLAPMHLSAPVFNGTDRRVAASLCPVAMRLRLRDTARLLAEELIDQDRPARPGRPWLLASIGGGPAPETWNALMILRRDHPALLAGRMIRIASLDTDEEGPRFGAACLAALTATGGPLEGLDTVFEAVRYDWSDPRELSALIRSTQGSDLLRADQGSALHRAAEGCALPPEAAGTGGFRGAVDCPVIAVTTEGGLFEYGTDLEIVETLRVLAAALPEDGVVAGSVIRDEATADPNLVALWRLREIPPRLLGLAAFRALAEAAGWRIRREIGANPCYHVVSLERALGTRGPTER